MDWHYEKFKGDAAIYGLCPKCHYTYIAGTRWRTTDEGEIFPYNYCPICGEKLRNKPLSEDVDIIWNERDCSELYELKEQAHEEYYKYYED